MDEKALVWIEQVKAGPPRWFRFWSWALSGLISLILALVIMLQWMVWLILTGQIFSPWSMGLGIVIVAAQILTLFGQKRETQVEACPIPGQKDPSSAA